MSVINKMLRDLDQRQAGQPGDAATPTPSRHTTLGTLPVQADQRPGATRQRLAWATVLLVAVMAGAWWYPQSGQESVPMPRSPAMPQSALVPIAAVATNVVATPPAVPPSAAPLTTKPKTAAKADAAKPPASTPTEAKPVMARVPAAKPTPRAQAAVVELAQPDAAAGSLRLENSLMRLPPTKNTATQTAAPQSSASQNPAPQITTLRPAALEAMAQAQSLWRSGSHAAATELLSQALSRVESTTPTDAPVTSQSPLASLARELARMQLADGQVGQALALLKRLQPQLVQVPDVWAMRGNAAQRLGQHAEAAQSYQKALALRPDEPRWMLGAAVSLAAQGQMVAAGELAEKAQNMGALRPDVANYLRQLGVVVRTD